MHLISPSEIVPDWDERVARLGEVTRRLAALEAERCELLAFMAAVGDATGDRRTAAAEAGCVMQVRRETAMGRMAHAQAVVELPPVLEGLRTGRLTVSHAAALVEAGEGYAPALVVEVVSGLLDSVAPDAVLLPSVLKRKVATRLAAADPSVAQARREGAEERTEVTRRPDRDGLSLLMMRVPHLQAEEIWAGLTRLAEVLRERGDERPLAVRRAAALLGLLRGLYPDGIFRGIDVPVFDLDVLVPLGLATGPVSVDGVALTPEQAQQAVLDARHVRAATTDPETGGVVATSRPVGRRAGGEEPPERLRAGLQDAELVDDLEAALFGAAADGAAASEDVTASDGEASADDEPTAAGVTAAAEPTAADEATDAAEPTAADEATDADEASAVREVVATDAAAAADDQAGSGMAPCVLARIEAVLSATVRLSPLSTDDYRPTARIGRYVRSRDEICTQPGCDRPAVLCDADHRRPWPLGPTSGDNLDSRCRFDHLVKQSGGDVRRAPNGDVLWTTPDGLRTYRRPALLDERPVIDRNAVLAALDRLRREAGSGPPRLPSRASARAPGPASAARLDTRDLRRPRAYVVDLDAYPRHRVPPPPF